VLVVAAITEVGTMPVAAVVAVVNSVIGLQGQKRQPWQQLTEVVALDRFSWAEEAAVAAVHSMVAAVDSSGSR
jgi:hypothetical protein